MRATINRVEVSYYEIGAESDKVKLTVENAFVFQGTGTLPSQAVFHLTPEEARLLAEVLLGYVEMKGKD